MIESQNAISLLLNHPLQEIGVTILVFSSQPVPDIEPGLPSELLLRRADIQAALYTLKSSLANQGAVGASYMPKLTFTSSVGSSFSDLLQLLQKPVAHLGAGIMLPFLQWSEMTLNKSISEIDYQIAVIDYGDTVYTAFEEVANLLTQKEHFFLQGNI